MEKTKQDLLLGLVFFAALGILLWATIELTGLSMLQRPTSREAVFPNAAGLRVGDNVFVLGHRLGQVGSLRLDSHSADPDARIRASLVLGEPIEFRDGYSLVIEPSGMLGGVQVQIDPGKGGTILAPDAVLRGSVRPGGLDAVGDLLGDGNVQRDVKAIVAGIREAIDRANRGEGTLGKLLTDPKLHDEFLAATSSAKKSLESIERGEGVFGRMIGDKSLGDAVADTVRRIDDLIQKLGSREGLLGRVINDPELADKANSIVTDIAATTADLRSGRGTIGMLFNDEGVSSRVRSTIAHVDSVSAKLDDPEAGAIGAFVGKAELRARAEQIVVDVADSVAQVRAGQGVLGRLVFDDRMADQLERVLNQVSRAIEDAREAAPVATFFTVLSGAF